MKRLLCVLMLAPLLSGCVSYSEDMSNLSKEYKDKAGDVIIKNDDKIENIEGVLEDNGL